MLGDTIVAIPALRVIRENFPEAHVCLLTREFPGKGFVSPQEVLGESGLVDEYIVYSSADPLKVLALCVRLRLRRFEHAVYLVRADDSEARIERDFRFFRVLGITSVLGARGIPRIPPRQEGEPLPVLQHVSDDLLDRLRKSGLKAPEAGHGSFDLRVGAAECSGVDRWAHGLPSDGGRRWVAVVPGSNMPAKVWPLDKYERVVAELITTFDVWPVVFGGPRERVLATELVRRLGRGYVAAGALSIRESMAALTKCAAYLGNDTGAMHMAAASGLRCVALFSARAHPGRWDPYGLGHRVFRVAVPCEGCMLEECIDQGMRCMLAIDEREVLQACKEVLGEESLNSAGGILA